MLYFLCAQDCKTCPTGVRTHSTAVSVWHGVHDTTHRQTLCACRTPEHDDPVVRPGAPEMDASLEPGTVPAPEQRGSTEWYEPEKAAEIKEQLAAEHQNPLG